MSLCPITHTHQGECLSYKAASHIVSPGSRLDLICTWYHHLIENKINSLQLKLREKQGRKILLATPHSKLMSEQKWKVKLDSTQPSLKNFPKHSGTVCMLWDNGLYFVIICHLYFNKTCTTSLMLPECCTGSLRDGIKGGELRISKIKLSEGSVS